jgi:hypothetical protein
MLYLLPILFPFGFAALWLLVTRLLVQLSGWGTLAQSYPARRASTGRRFSFVSGGIGSRAFPVSYRSCLTVTIGETGFFLSLWPIFRSFRAPDLFIPWSAVERLEDRKLLFMSYPTIHLRDLQPVISIYWSPGRALSEAWQAHLSAKP